MKKRFSKSVRKFIRMEKGRLRREFFGNPEKIKEETTKLYEKFGRIKEKGREID